MNNNIPTAIFEVASLNLERPVIQVFEDGICDTWTFQDIQTSSIQFAKALRNLGFQMGDRVVILSENRPEWCIAYLGVVAIGAIAVPFDIQYSTEEVLTLINDCEPRGIIVTNRTSSLLSSDVNAEHIITLDSTSVPEQKSFHHCLENLGGLPEDKDLFFQTIPPDAAASLLYTSGTTGNPKGVLLSHRNLLSNAEAIQAANIATQTDNILSILPLHHAYPFMVSFLIPVLLGARITFLQTLKGPELLACVREAKVTIIVAVPQVYAQFHRAMLSDLESRPIVIQRVASALMGLSGRMRSLMDWNFGKKFFSEAHKRFGQTLRLLISGGARLDPDVAGFLYQMGFTVLEGYGLSETAPILTFNPLEKQKIGSVGRPMNGVELCIAAPNEHGIGEVTARGPNVMLGYFKNQKATSEIIRDGVLWTGDLGYLDRDGYLFLTGRSKELIVLGGGKNVYPEEVEEVYRLSNAINDICIVGVELSVEGGEALHAVVHPDFPYLKTNKIGNVEETIRGELHGLSGRLASHKRASGLTIVKDPLPRTRLGKLQRHRVRALVVSKSSLSSSGLMTAADEEIMNAEPGVSVLAALRSVIGSRRLVHLDDHLGLDLGIDSLRRIDMVVAIERKFGPLPESFAVEVATVREIIEQLSTLKPSGKIIELTGSDQKESVGSWAEILKGAGVENINLPLHAENVTWHHRLLVRLVCGLLYCIARVIFRATTEGVKYIPKQGPCLLASNHASFMDAFVVASLMPYDVFERTFFLGWEQYFRNRFTAIFAEAAHIVSVDGEKHLMKAMKSTAALLREGKLVVIFPEGCRTLDGSLFPFRNGIGVLAVELGVPVVPIWIRGTYQAWPIGQMFPRPGKVAVVFGKPISIHSDDHKDSEFKGKDEYENFTLRVREEIVKLSCSQL